MLFSDISERVRVTSSLVTLVLRSPSGCHLLPPPRIKAQICVSFKFGSFWNSVATVLNQLRTICPRRKTHQTQSRAPREQATLPRTDARQIQTQELVLIRACATCQRHQGQERRLRRGFRIEWLRLCLRRFR